MNRFFGIMPVSEVEITKTYKDSNNHTVIIEAGPNGYTIIFGDNSTKYKDVTSNTEQNFKEAYEAATHIVGGLIEIESAISSDNSL